VQCGPRRAVENLGEAMGITSLSKSQVFKMVKRSGLWTITRTRDRGSGGLMGSSQKQVEPLGRREPPEDSTRPIVQFTGDVDESGRRNTGQVDAFGEVLMFSFVQRCQRVDPSMGWLR